MNKYQICQQAILDRLYYDPSTGIVYQKRNGQPCKSEYHIGYVRYTLIVRMKRYRFRSGILAWFLYHGEWPSNTINHINSDRRDDRIENLEDIPLSENIKLMHNNKVK